ncbi:MAG: hypothetical protein N3E51_01955 [Candidatus Micrarchaeota archaeon]|nr:hypothetical protein [Candidatus Micrarchaeota archaeon]
MGTTDFEIKLQKEAKTGLQLYRDQSLLRRKFGEEAVRLYDMIDSEKTAAEIMAELGMDEKKFMEILEFMNNNGIVSVVPASGQQEAQTPAAAQPPDAEKKEGEESTAEPPAKKPVSEELLSPLEKLLYQKFGPTGVQIYNLIDGEKTAEEILRETGISETKLVEILEFMDEQGIIKLEKPQEKEEDESEEEETEEEEEEKEKEGESKPPAREPRFKPMLEEEPEETPFTPPKPPPKKEEKKEQKPEEKQEFEDLIPVDVPSMSNLTLVQKAVMFAELATKFGKSGRALIDLVDGKRDFVELALLTGLSFFEIDAIMAYFGKKGFITFRQLSREEIKKKYGEDGFAIYKKAGRDGILLYEMIGKETSLKDIILKSKLDPDRAIDIFVFIHKVLGLDIPIDRNVIYRQLGLKK